MNALLHLALLLASLADPQASVVVLGEGAGVIIDARGYVVTCLHVVGSKDEWLVRLADKRLFAGRVVARDAGRELALLKLDTDRRFLPARLATAAPRVREPVTAVGHPKGYEWTVSSGHVSALGRTIKIGELGSFSGLLQTDAAINPGNSGGGLFNASGELLGIPLAIREGAQGIAFVIPAATIREFLDTHLPK